MYCPKNLFHCPVFMRRPQGKIGNNLPRVSGMTSTSTECRGCSQPYSVKTVLQNLLLVSEKQTILDPIVLS